MSPERSDSAMTADEVRKQTMRPTGYSTLMEDGIGSELREAEKAISEAHGAASARLKGQLKDAMHRAYWTGLQHGFQQGVEAECKVRDIQAQGNKQVADV